MRTPVTVRALIPNEAGLARWEVSGGGPSGEVVRLGDGTLLCITCWSLVCAHVHRVVPHVKN